MINKMRFNQNLPQLCEKLSPLCQNLSGRMIGLRRGSLSALSARSCSSAVQTSSAPVYPEIKDITWRGRRKDEAAAWHKKIQELGTVEEKLLEVNMPRYYGWNCTLVEEGKMFYDSLPLTQHATKTHLVKGLPSIYNLEDAEAAAAQLANEVKAEFEEALVYEMSRSVDKEDLSPQEVEAARAPKVTETLNAVLMSRLRRHCPHLNDIVSHAKTRLEAGWCVGGIEIPGNRRKTLEKQDYLKELLTWPVDRHFQYVGNPMLQLRAKQPLLPILAIEQSQNADLEVPQYNLDPRTKGIPSRRRYVTNIPGFWPNEAQKFGTVSFISRDWLHDCKYSEEEKEVLLHSQGIFSSFAWLFSQACYLGFSTFNDITYPLVSQTVITNGQQWSFYTYQLNTTVIQFDEAHPKRNVCWSSKPMSLFESIENGKINGFNDEVLKTLIKFYLNQPRERKGVDLTPYLQKSAPTVAHVEDEKRRVFQEELFKKVSRNGERHNPDPEYWNWEWIYKIRHKTRPVDARRRPFETWQNPWATRFQDLPPKFVPKKDRENPSNKRQKWAKTYYP